MALSKDDVKKIINRIIKNRLKVAVKKRGWSKLKKLERNVDEQILKEIYEERKRRPWISLSASLSSKILEKIFSKYRIKGWSIKEVGSGGVRYKNRIQTNDPEIIFYEFS